MVEPNTCSQRPWVVGVAAKATLERKEGELAEDGDQKVAKIPKGVQKAHKLPVRDVKREVFLEGPSSSSERYNFHYCTCKIVMFSGKEYRDHLDGKVHP